MSTVIAFTTVPMADSTGSARNIACPAGVQLNDIIYFHGVALGSTLNGGYGSITIPSGFTLLDSQDNGDGAGFLSRSYVAYRVATSADVTLSQSGGNYSFTPSVVGSFNGTAGAAIILTHGNDITTPQVSGTPGGAGGTNRTWGVGLAPAKANSILMFFVGFGSGISSPYSGFACATSNPTWTKMYDFDTSGGGTQWLGGMVGWWASRPQTTNTGNLTATVSSNVNGADTGQLVVVPPGITVAITDTLTETDKLGFGVGISQKETLTATDKIVTTFQQIWNTITKPITNWIFPNKE